MSSFPKIVIELEIVHSSSAFNFGSGGEPQAFPGDSRLQPKDHGTEDEFEYPGKPGPFLGAT
jgi:hypothetical protein